jgi:hypothetical protein
MQYHPQPITDCGDPSRPDLRDQPELPAEIQNDWGVAGTRSAFVEWLTAAKPTGAAARKGGRQ